VLSLPFLLNQFKRNLLFRPKGRLRKTKSIRTALKNSRKKRKKTDAKKQRPFAQG
jgi:hypothetical protein